MSGEVNDGLVALLTALTEAKPDWDLIVQPRPTLWQTAGNAAKNHLQKVLAKFIKETSGWTKQLTMRDYRLPSYCSGVDLWTENYLLVRGTSGNELTTFDAMVTVCERPTIVDVRTMKWRYAKGKYFKKQDAARATFLEDVFGEGNYARVLALPKDCAPHRIFRGVHIAALPFTQDEFYKKTEEVLQCNTPVLPSDQ